MARCTNPGYVNYSGDGSGRDSYIILNNGGLTHEPKDHMMWSSKIKTPRVMQKSPHKGAVGFQYRSDGSGRDSYVLKNSGGLKIDFRGGMAHSIFSSTLRTMDNTPQCTANLLNQNDRSRYLTPRQREANQARVTF